jgi:hypothetical protein
MRVINKCGKRPYTLINSYNWLYKVSINYHKPYNHYYHDTAHILYRNNITKDLFTWNDNWDKE